MIAMAFGPVTLVANTSLLLGFKLFGRYCLTLLACIILAACSTTSPSVIERTIRGVETLWPPLVSRSRTKYPSPSSRPASQRISCSLVIALSKRYKSLQVKKIFPFHSYYSTNFAMDLTFPSPWLDCGEQPLANLTLSANLRVCRHAL